MRFILLLSLVCVSFAVTAEDVATVASPTVQTAHVKADRVNLRGRPDANGEVVGQVSSSDALQVIEAGEIWVSVVPPESIKCWVHKDFVQDGKVSVKELTVRAGASINYPRIGSLFRGNEVAARETFGEWICIPPPTNAIVWIHRDLLDMGPGNVVVRPTQPAAAIDANALDAHPEIPVATNRTTIRISPSEPVRETVIAGTPPQHQIVAMPPRVTTYTLAETNAASAAPADLNLIPLQGQGLVMRHEGFVKASAYTTAPANHRLVLKKDDTLETVCYLRGNNSQLTSLADQYLMMQGREYWVQGVKEPVLVIERIERRDVPTPTPVETPEKP